jgi:hypothetical protein
LKQSKKKRLIADCVMERDIYPYLKKKESDVLEEVCMMCKKKLTPPTVTIPDTEDGQKGGKVHNMCFIEALMLMRKRG